LSGGKFCLAELANELRELRVGARGEENLRGGGGRQW